MGKRLLAALGSVGVAIVGLVVQGLMGKEANLWLWGAVGVALVAVSWFWNPIGNWVGRRKRATAIGQRGTDDQPFGDAVHYVLTDCLYGSNKTWDWISSDLIEEARAGHINVRVSNTPNGNLRPMTLEELKKVIVNVQQTNLPGWFELRHRMGRDDFFYRPTLTKSEVETRFKNKPLFLLESDIPCDFPVKAALKHAIGVSKQGTTEKDVFEKFRGHGVGGELLISTMHGSQRVYWLPAEFKGMQFVYQNDKVVLRSRLTGDVFYSPMFNRKQVLDLWPAQLDDSTYDMSGLDAMSHLLNYSHLKYLEPTPRASELGQQLLQGAIDGRIRLWMAPGVKQPLRLIPTHELRTATIDKEPRKGEPVELTFAMTVAVGDYKGRWVNPWFSSKDIDQYCKWADAEVAGDLHPSVSKESESPSTGQLPPT